MPSMDEKKEPGKVEEPPKMDLRAQVDRLGMAWTGEATPRAAKAKAHAVAMDRQYRKRQTEKHQEFTASKEEALAKTRRGWSSEEMDQKISEVLAEELPEAHDGLHAQDEGVAL